jgi:uncharacterized protein (UPF0332 family)
MDRGEETRRWDTSQELYEAADVARRQQRYRACVGLAYYACFQAMWVALGDPPLGEWRHVGITRRFCHGQWTDPPLIPTSLAALHRRLLALYELRLDAHYRAQPIDSQKARQALDTVAEVRRLAQQHKRKGV